MDDDPTDGFDAEEDYYAFLNVAKTVSIGIGCRVIAFRSIDSNSNDGIWCIHWECSNIREIWCNMRFFPTRAILRHTSD